VAVAVSAGAASRLERVDVCGGAKRLVATGDFSVRQFEGRAFACELDHGLVLELTSDTETEVAADANCSSLRLVGGALHSLTRGGVLHVAPRSAPLDAPGPVKASFLDEQLHGLVLLTDDSVWARRSTGWQAVAQGVEQLLVTGDRVAVVHRDGVVRRLVFDVEGPRVLMLDHSGVTRSEVFLLRDGALVTLNDLDIVDAHISSTGESLPIAVHKAATVLDGELYRVAPCPGCARPAQLLRGSIPLGEVGVDSLVLRTAGHGQIAVLDRELKAGRGPVRAVVGDGLATVAGDVGQRFLLVGSTLWEPQEEAPDGSRELIRRWADGHAETVAPSVVAGSFGAWERGAYWVTAEGSGARLWLDLRAR
jgi:hypothetical protein